MTREVGSASEASAGAGTRLGAYYNEFDPFASQWIRNLISKGLVAPGVVDDRPIQQVQPGDVPGRAHFFAGIAGWELALQLAGWPSDRPVWTGSCPCQPFSAAGKRKGVEDERHLWPEFRRLIAECRPPVVFGEQVASADGRLWLAGVRSDLEALGYAVGASDLCSAGVGAPNIRQRLYWVASANGGQRYGLPGSQGGERDGQAAGWFQGDGEPECGGSVGGMACAQGARLEGWGDGQGWIHQGPGGLLPAGPGDDAGWVGNAFGDREERPGGQQRIPNATGALGYWSAFDILPCLDGKARRIEPGSFPLAHGVPGRVGRLRGYGNAINPQVAAEFIAAFLEAESPRPAEASEAEQSPSPKIHP